MIRALPSADAGVVNSSIGATSALLLPHVSALTGAATPDLGGALPSDLSPRDRALSRHAL